MITYIGAENIISPLGVTSQENFNNIKQAKTGIACYQEIGFGKENIYLSKFKTQTNFYDLIVNCLKAVIAESITNLIFDKKTLVIISTTKADIQENIAAPILFSINKLKQEFNLYNNPIVVSNACVSGVLAMNTANNYLKAGVYENVFVIGADVISDFVLFGFQSLFAISEMRCQPFDKNRKGITLGEGAGGVLMSINKDVYKSSCFEFVEGTSSNDANHISGPSRTGEGLFRSIKNTLELAKLNPSDIDFISAHGTGTLFNDEMEAVAFGRLKMNKIPLNSLKGYFGHTLGAAGLIEMVICIQSLRNNLAIKSLGYNHQGTTEKINVTTQNINMEINTILKTASGFGGCNASAIISKLK